MDQLTLLEALFVSWAEERLQSLTEDLQPRATAWEDEGNGSVRCGNKSSSFPFPFSLAFLLSP